MPSVLIVDDSITIRQAIRVALKKAGLFDTFHEARNGAEALTKVEEQMPDVVLCDIVMPEMDGFEFLRLAKENPKYADLPIIMLTGQESVEKKIEGLELGASDYLTKPFDPGELIARVKVQLKIKRLQDELKQANERYKELARTDYLTGLFNRRHFMEILKSAFERCKRYNQPLGFIILDIDHFKKVNDTMGHQQGDKILIEFAKSLKTNLRSHDTVARYGGEEFVVALPMADEAEARMVARKIRRVTAQTDFEGMNAPVTVSAGICCWPKDGINTIDELISKADDALYAAKNGGRNCVMVYLSKDLFDRVED